MEVSWDNMIFILKTTANREDQVMDFVEANARKKKLQIYALARPHGLRGYVLIEALDAKEAELAVKGIPYAKSILPKPVSYEEIEHMFVKEKTKMIVKVNDIVEIISGPFKREKAKVKKVDEAKEEVVVELLEATAPIPIPLKMDAIKVIRRESEEEQEKEE